MNATRELVQRVDTAAGAPAPAVQSPSTRRTWWSRIRNLTPLPWIAPTILMIFAVIAFPAGYSIYLSFMKVNRIGQITGFAGLDNYASLAREPVLGLVVLNTLVWLIVVVAAAMVLSLALATFMNSGVRGERFLRFSLIVPWAAALVMTSVVWRFILEGRTGLLNRILNDLGILAGYPDWYKDPKTAFASVMVVGIITSIPFTTYILLGGIKNVPHELLEAATVDGASKARAWVSIVLPTIRPTLFVAMVLNLLHVFNAFTVIWVITGAGAGNMADTTITWMYKIAFNVQLDTGKAAALGTLNVVFLVVLIILYMRIAGPVESERGGGSRSTALRRIRNDLGDVVTLASIALARATATARRVLSRFTAPLAGPFSTLIAVLIGLFFLAPYGVMFLASLKTTRELWSMPATYLPETWMWSNYVDVWQKIPLADYFQVSLTVAALSTIVVVLVATPAAYIASRLEFRGKATFLGLILVTQMFPGVALIVGLYQEALMVNAIGEYWFIILINASFNLAFAIWILYANMSSVPRELDEAAMLDGLGRMRILLRVILPLIGSGLVTVVIFTFIQVWNEFMLALTVFNDPSRDRVVLTVGVQKFVGIFETNYQYLFAASLMAIIPAVILFSLIERRLVGGLTAGAIK